MRGTPSQSVRTLSSVVDALAVQQPHDVWVRVPRASTVEDGFDDITWLQLATAVDRLAYWMFYAQGVRADHGSIAYTGVNDVRYGMVVLAAMKVGCKVLLTSPRNSEEGQLSLLEATKCVKVFCSTEMGDRLGKFSELIRRFPLSTIPSLATLLEQTDTMVDFSGPKFVNERQQSLILHSSGSTGLPKPIYLTHGSLGVIDTIKSMPTASGRQHVFGEVFTSDPMLSMMPWFHVMGVTLLARSIFHQGLLILLPASVPPNVEMIMKVIHSEKPVSAAFAPSMLTDVCTTPGGLDALAKLQRIIYGGAPLARSSGDKITQVTRLYNGIGSTEILNVPTYILEHKEDWDYYEWDESAGVVMEAVGAGLFELVIKRVKDRNDQFVFHNFPDLDEWRTKDLFEQHPVRSHLWRYCGRADDIIVLSNGEKFSPTSFETTVAQHPAIAAALMVGAGRFQTSLIVEPASAIVTTEHAHSFIDGVWTQIEEANSGAPAYARVFKPMVIITSPDRPLVRSAKGTVMRNASTKLYEEDVDKRYAQNAAETWSGAPQTPFATADVKEVEEVIRAAFEAALPPFNSATSNDENIFTLGVDSLLVQRLSSLLESSFPPHQALITPRTIYSNPTVASLARAVHSQSEAKTSHSPQLTQVSREQTMSRLVHQYTLDLPKPRSRAPSVVLLTGSTGALGTHILHTLIQDQSITRIYCLNRSSDALIRQIASFASRSLVANFTRTTFLQADLTKPQLGLSAINFSALASTVTAIIHNAWPVNFNLPLSAFESSITGVRKLVDFASLATFAPHILFVSSVASTGNWEAVRPDFPSIPEFFDPDNSLPLPTGYGESKHVASAILARACAQGAITATILRVGQLAGPRKGSGEWNRNEWVPSLVATSAALGKIPAALGEGGEVSAWLCVDDAAEACVDILKARVSETTIKGGHAGDELVTLNLTHPVPTPWSILLPAVRSRFSAVHSGPELETVTLKEWVEALEALPNTEENVKSYPALKLLDVFKDLRDRSASPGVVFETEEARSYAPCLQTVPAVDGEMMGRWMGTWGL